MFLQRLSARERAVFDPRTWEASTALVSARLANRKVLQRGVIDMAMPPAAPPSGPQSDPDPDHFPAPDADPQQPDQEPPEPDSDPPEQGSSQ